MVQRAPWKTGAEVGQRQSSVYAGTAVKASDRASTFLLLILVEKIIAADSVAKSSVLG
jgi:hypothetical protein